MEHIGTKENDFYINSADPTEEDGVSFEARLLFILKYLAYEVPPVLTSRCYFDQQRLHSSEEIYKAIILRRMSQAPNHIWCLELP